MLVKSFTNLERMEVRRPRVYSQLDDSDNPMNHLNRGRKERDLGSLITIREESRCGGVVASFEASTLPLNLLAITDLSSWQAHCEKKPPKSSTKLLVLLLSSGWQQIPRPSQQTAISFFQHSNNLISCYLSAEVGSSLHGILASR